MFNPLVPSEHDDVKGMIIDQDDADNDLDPNIENTQEFTQENAGTASEEVQADGSLEIDFYKKSHL